MESMSTSTTTSASSFLKNLGIYQIIGGGVGVLLILWALMNLQDIQPLLVGIYVVFSLFYSFSIYCGILCVRHKETAMKLSLLNQIIQTLGIAILGFAFQFAAGLYISAGLDLSESFELKFGAGISKFDFNFNNEEGRVEVNLNFVALGLIMLITKQRKKVEQENLVNQISQIAES
jgi:hypothetical protein